MVGVGFADRWNECLPGIVLGPDPVRPETGPRFRPIHLACSIIAHSFVDHGGLSRMRIGEGHCSRVSCESWRPDRGRAHADSLDR